MSAITETKPVVVPEPVVLAAPIEVPGEQPKHAAVSAVEPEVAAATEVKPMVDDAHTQPTASHAEMSTLHTATEAATTVDGTPADKPVEDAPSVAFAEPTSETKEEHKEGKKVAATEKVEKTKVEGKGFFAKFFGSKDKSPKEKKVKTPKNEQADPIVAVAAVEPAATETTSSVPMAEDKPTGPTESKPEITGAALVAGPVAEPIAQVPVAVPEEAPVASTSAVVAEPEAVKEAETTAVAPVVTSAEPAVIETRTDEATTGEKDVKALKAHRRLSTRFTSFVKNIGKKEHHGKDEHGKDAAESHVETSAPMVSDEAPKIAEPMPSEPIHIDEKKPTTTTHAAPAAPVVAATA